METSVKLRKLIFGRSGAVGKFDNFIERYIPRRCMVISVGLILLGGSIITLMTIQLLPITMGSGLITLSLVATGGVLTLIFAGKM